MLIESCEFNIGSARTIRVSEWAIFNVKGIKFIRASSSNVFLAYDLYTVTMFRHGKVITRTC